MFWRKSKIISLQIDEDLCSGCGNCVVRCRRNVLNLMNDRDHLYAVVLSPENCKGCGHCQEVCSKKAIEIIKQ